MFIYMSLFITFFFFFYLAEPLVVVRTNPSGAHTTRWECTTLTNKVWFGGTLADVT